MAAQISTSTLVSFVNETLAHQSCSQAYEVERYLRGEGSKGLYEVEEVRYFGNGRSEVLKRWRK